MQTAIFIFPRQLRLKSKQDFVYVLRSGRKIKTTHATIFLAPNQFKYARLGIIASAKNVNTAVKRNLLKRITRDSFRVKRLSLGNVDFVVRLEPGAATAKRKDFRATLDDFWAQNLCVK